jgi:hypothetical protein
MRQSHLQKHLAVGCISILLRNFCGSGFVLHCICNNKIGSFRLIYKLRAEGLVTEHSLHGISFRTILINLSGSPNITWDTDNLENPWDLDGLS